MKKWLTCLMALLMLTSSAMAESLTGTVVSTETVSVLAPAAGTIENVYVTPGVHVEDDTEVASLYAQKVYAEQSGTVRLFGKEGDAVETLTSRYGGVLYIEPACQYTISASTSKAYDSIETKIVHPGETVYFRCTADDSHEGKGIVTLVSGSSYTIEVTEGVFKDDEYVYIYRDEKYTSAQRLGRGTVNREEAVAYTGTGVVSAVCVEDGVHVECGDLLYETIESTAYTHRVSSSVSGTVASVSVAAGDAVEQGTLVAQIYPDSAMRLEVSAEEYDLRTLKAGAKVEIAFQNGVSATGVVERVSGVQQTVETTDETEEPDPTFAVYIAFEAEEAVSYGMTAKITTAE